MNNDSYITKNDLRSMLYSLVDLVIDGCVDTTIVPVDSIHNNTYNSDISKNKSKLLTPKDIVAIYGIGINRARALMKNEDFPSFKLDEKYYVQTERAEEYFRNVQGVETELSLNKRKR